VLGFAPHNRTLTKSGAKPGDRLFITKPLGFGVTTTALKQEKAEEVHIQQVVDWMKRLNRDAALSARAVELTGATDITGYSLMGHACEIANASGVGLHFFQSKIPYIDGAEKYAALGTFPGGASDNRMYFGKQVQFNQVDEPHQMLLFDPQTSGGLLLSVPENKVKLFREKAEELSQPIWEIGEVTTGSGIFVD